MINNITHLSPTTKTISATISPKKELSITSKPDTVSFGGDLDQIYNDIITLSAESIQSGTMGKEKYDKLKTIIRKGFDSPESLEQLSRVAKEINSNPEYCPDGDNTVAFILNEEIGRVAASLPSEKAKLAKEFATVFCENDCYLPIIEAINAGNTWMPGPMDPDVFIGCPNEEIMLTTLLEKAPPKKLQKAITQEGLLGISISQRALEREEKALKKKEGRAEKGLLNNALLKLGFKKESPPVVPLPAQLWENFQILDSIKIKQDKYRRGF